MIRTLALAALGLSLAGCTIPAHADTPAVSDDGLMIPRHEQCSETGALVFRYLHTGDNEGYAALDLRYSLYVGTTEEQTRAIADQAMLNCDAEWDAAEAEQREAQRQRDAEQREAQRKRDAEQQRMRFNAAALASCNAVGGIIQGEYTYCAAATWNTDPDCFQWMNFMSDGTIDQRAIDLLAPKCIKGS